MNNTERLLRLSDVLKLFPVGKTYWYQGIKRGEYPEPIKIGRMSFWPASKIYDLIDEIVQSKQSN